MWTVLLFFSFHPAPNYCMLMSQMNKASEFPNKEKGNTSTLSWRNVCLQSSLLQMTKQKWFTSHILPPPLYLTKSYWPTLTLCSSWTCSLTSQSRQLRSFERGVFLTFWTPIRLQLFSHGFHLCFAACPNRSLLLGFLLLCLLQGLFILFLLFPISKFPKVCPQPFFFFFFPLYLSDFILTHEFKNCSSLDDLG